MHSYIIATFNLFDLSNLRYIIYNEGLGPKKVHYKNLEGELGSSMKSTIEAQSLGSHGLDLFSKLLPTQFLQGWIG